MRLLLAEDEQDLSKALVTVLKHNNYSVDAVFNGEDALTYLENGNYDGVILDIMMPKKDGKEVCREIREIAPKPVIMITAKGEVFDKVLGLELGADDYMVKPFDLKELSARIKAVLRRSAGQSSSAEATKEVSFKPKFVGNV